ncbi:MAG: TAXI family TRAP transporter solute-binding subunit [Proteobacteria bacterium]|nr:TAXI family TRAP transporter solute-binding subunit [Pseudomonadota bacterium]
MSSTNDSSDKLPSNPRRRKQTALLALLAGLFIFAIAASAAYYALRPVTLRIAVGPAGSGDQKLIQALAKTFERDRSAVRLSVVTTDGTAESIALLGAAKADLAVARGDLDMPADAESVAILRKNVVVLWSSPGVKTKNAKKEPPPKVKEIGDLAGHRIGVVGRSQSNATLLRVILTESGVNPDKVAVSKYDLANIIDMIRDPTLDAFMTVGPLDSKITAEAIAMTAKLRGEPKFLPIDVSEAIAERHSRYESEEISGSSFSSSPARPADKIETVGVNHLIVAPKSLSETTVGALTRQLFAARRLLAKELPSALRIAKPDTDKDAALPAHPGAAAYIDGTERTFLEKYSDYLWAAVLLLSGLGSGIAGLRHYLNRDEQEQNTQHRNQLLEKIAKVRGINSLDDLAAMQREADDLLRETLACYDDGLIEEGGLSAFSLVLEQFHHAVVERRVALGAAPHAADAPRMRAL